MTLWFTARGAGLALLVAFSLAVGAGAVATVPRLGPTPRYLVQYVHRAAGGFGLALLVVHVGSVLLDPYAGVGVLGALVPFASGYRPGAVALGSITAYVLLLVTATGLARGRLAGHARAARIWRGVHLLTWPAWAAAVAHALLAGTDTGTAWVQALVGMCVGVVVAAAAVRLLAGRPRTRHTGLLAAAPGRPAVRELAGAGR